MACSQDRVHLVHVVKRTFLHRALHCLYNIVHRATLENSVFTECDTLFKYVLNTKKKKSELHFALDQPRIHCRPMWLHFALGQCQLQKVDTFCGKAFLATFLVTGPTVIQYVQFVERRAIRQELAVLLSSAL